MPRIAKGGKYIYGWSTVREDWTIPVPPEAIFEYGLTGGERLIVMRGSRTSGGFTLSRLKSLEGSVLRDRISVIPGLIDGDIPKGEMVRSGGYTLSWTSLDEDNSISLKERTLLQYQIEYGQILLVIRGSGIGLSFASKGPIVGLARDHPEIEVFR